MFLIKTSRTYTFLLMVSGDASSKSFILKSAKTLINSSQDQFMSFLFKNPNSTGTYTTKLFMVKVLTQFKSTFSSH